MSNVTSATFSYSDPATLSQQLAAHLQQQGIAYEQSPHRVLAKGEGFEVCLELKVDASKQRHRVSVTCAPEQMPLYREYIQHQLKGIESNFPMLRWSGVPGELASVGEPPAGFCEAQVAGVEPFGDAWWRLSLKLSPKDIARYCSSKLHFSLLRPATEQDTPVWPMMNEYGTISWPKGEQVLTRKAFTVSAVNEQSGLLFVDIYRHEGGPTSDWAASNPVGQTIGLIGPSGEGPHLDETEANEQWLLGADETSLPTLARVLQSGPKNTENLTLVLLVQSPNDKVALPKIKGQVQWLYRCQGASQRDLVAAMTEQLESRADLQQLWFAAGAQSAKAVRQVALKIDTIPRRNIKSYGFWS